MNDANDRPVEQPGTNDSATPQESQTGRSSAFGAFTHAFLHNLKNAAEHPEEVQDWEAQRDARLGAIIDERLKKSREDSGPDTGGAPQENS